MILGLALLAVAGTVGWFGTTIAKSGFDDLKYSWREVKTPPLPLRLQKAALYFVEVGPDAYQIGVIVKLFNPSDRAQIIEDIVVESVPHDWEIRARGSWYIQKILASEDQPIELEDSYARPTAEAYFKRLLPFKIFMTRNGGDTPFLILRGPWTVRTTEQTLRSTPPFYAVNADLITKQEWDSLLKPGSPLNVETLHYELLIEPPGVGPKALQLLYNADRTATIDNPYVDQTTVVRSEAGAMVFAAIPQGVELGQGWVPLGATYEDAWSNPQSLRIYNSVYPPDSDGKPRAFGVFAGRDAEMLGVSRVMTN
jgi:hypothetical protein